MREFFHQLATRLAPHMIWVWLIVVASIGLFVWTLTHSNSEAEDSIMLLAATSCAWAIGLIAIRAHFYHPPITAQPNASLFQRGKATLLRFLSACLALAMVGCTLALLLMSYKAVSFYLSA